MQIIRIKTNLRVYLSFNDISQYLNHSNCTIKHGMKFELIKNIDYIF